MRIVIFSSTPDAVIKYCRDNNHEFTIVTKKDVREGRYLANTDTYDFGIVYNFGEILKEEYVDKYKLFNIHFAFLPKYRGSVPVEATLLNGDKYIGLTIHRTVKELDAGDIVCIKRFKIEDSDNSVTLREKLDGAIPEILKETFRGGVENLTYTKQMGISTYCNKSMLKKSRAEILFGRMSAKEIFNRVRAFRRDPIAWAKIQFVNKEVVMNILSAELCKEHVVYLKPCEMRFLKGRGFLVGTLLGNILLTSVCIEGKKTLCGQEIASIKDRIEFL